MAKNDVDLRVNLELNSKDFIKDVTIATSKSGLQMEQELEDTINRAQKTLLKFRDLQNEIVNTGVLPDGMTKSMYTAEKSAARLASKFIDLYNAEQKAANAPTQELTEKYAELAKQEEKLTEKRQNVADSSSRLRSNISGYAELKDYFGQNDDDLMRAFEIQDQIENLQNRSDKHRKKYGLGIGQQDRYTKGIATQINNLQTEFDTKGLDEVISKFNELQYIIESTEALYGKDITTSEGMEALKSQLDTINEKFEKTQQELTKVRAEMSKTTKYKTTGISDADVSSVKDAALQYEVLATQADNAEQEIRNVNGEIKNTSYKSKLISSAFKGITKVIRTCLGVVKKLFHTIRTGHKSIDRHQGKLLKWITNYVLGFRSLYWLVRGIKMAAVDAFKVMAQQVPYVNKQISSLVTNFNQIKASTATMVQPLLKWVVPAFEKLTQVATSAMEAVAKLFAVLTGQNFIIKASAAWVDYADSVREAKNELMDIDELNVLGDNNNDIFSTDTIKYNYEYLDAEDMDLLTQIKEAWDNADFTDIGKKLSAKVADVFKNLNAKLPEINTYAQKLVDSLATAINGFTSDTRSAEEIGKFFGNLVVNAFNNITRFLKKTNWKDVATWLLTDAKSFMEQNPAGAFGETIGALIQAIADVVGVFAADKEFWTLLDEQICTGIETALNSLTDEDWENLFGDLMTIAKHIATGLGHAVEAAWDSLPDGAKTIAIGLVLSAGISKLLGSAFVKGAIKGAVEKKLLQSGEYTKTSSGLNTGQSNGLTTSSGLSLAESFQIIGSILFGWKIAATVVDMGAEAMGVDSGLTGDYVTDVSNGIEASAELVADDIRENIIDTPISDTSSPLYPLYDVTHQLSTFIQDVYTNLKLAIYGTGEHLSDAGGLHGGSGRSRRSETLTAEDLGINLDFDVTTFNDDGVMLGSNIISGLSKGISDTATKESDNIQKSFKTIGNIAVQYYDIHSPSKLFYGYGQNIVMGFKNGIAKTFETLTPQFSALWAQLPPLVKTPLNTIIGYLNQFLQKIQQVQNSVADAFNAMSGLNLSGSAGNVSVNANVSKWTAPSIPALATGAVIPANKPFLAMLGDQSNGTNIEAPLSTIEEAVANVLEPYLAQIADNTRITANKNFSVAIGDKEIAKANIRGQKKMGRTIISTT